jgi:hypothetical protein
MTNENLKKTFVKCEFETSNYWEFLSKVKFGIKSVKTLNLFKIKRKKCIQILTINLIFMA